MKAAAISEKPCFEIKKFIDKVHRHVDGHASFTYFKLILERNVIWSKIVIQCIEQMINECQNCKSSAPPEPSCKVSISSMSKNINEIVYFDHFI